MSSQRLCPRGQGRDEKKERDEFRASRRKPTNPRLDFFTLKHAGQRIIGKLHGKRSKGFIKAAKPRKHPVSRCESWLLPARLASTLVHLEISLEKGSCIGSARGATVRHDLMPWLLADPRPSPASPGRLRRPRISLVQQRYACVVDFGHQLCPTITQRRAGRPAMTSWPVSAAN